MAYLPDKTQPRAVRLAQAIDTLMEMKLDRLRAQDQLTTCARYEEALRGGTIESKQDLFSDSSYFQLVALMLEKKEEVVFEFITATLTDLEV